MRSSWCAAGRRVGTSVLPTAGSCRRAPERGRRNPGADVRVASSMAPLSLSVLDLVPVRTGQRSADAVAATVALAQRADGLGLKRYWLAEHHNMPSVASTNPPVLLGVLAGRTERIRLGSGGVMLPNHAPFVIAEQFAALEAAAPGRIDLGIGRAPGSDPVISALLRSTGHTSDVDAFPNHVQDIEALLGEDGAGLRLATGEQYVVRATPAAAGRPDDLAARLQRLLGRARRPPRPAVRVRPPLLGRGHRPRARPLPVAVPAERAARRAADLPHRQRRGGRDRRGGGTAGAPAAAAHGAAAHRHATHRARHGRGRPGGDDDRAAAGPDRGDARPLVHRRGRRTSRIASPPSRSGSRSTRSW